VREPPGQCARPPERAERPHVFERLRPDTQVRDGLSEKYDAKTQLYSGTQSQAQSRMLNILGIQVDGNAEVMVDDVIA